MSDLIEDVLDRVRVVVRQEIRAALEESQPDSAPPEELLSLEQAAVLLGLSKQTIYGFTSTRNIPHYKRGKHLIFKRSELVDWLTQNPRKTQNVLRAESLGALRKGGRSL